MTGREARAPGFWRTVVVLLDAARRRTRGRMRRRSELRRARGGLAWAPMFGVLVLLGLAAIVHVIAAIDLAQAVDAAERLVTRGAATTLPDLAALAVLLLWALMLACQGEAPEIDAQRARQPMWEWLFSHPAPPAAIFLAEMLAPIAANPAFLTAPLFAGVVFGEAYGLEAGVLAAAVAGVPATIALACLGKAIEINVLLRLAPGTRGAVLGVMGWLGFATATLFLFAAGSVGAIVRAAAPWLEALPVPPVRALFGDAAPGGDDALWQGLALSALAAALVAAFAVALARAGARHGLVGTSAQAAPRSAKGPARFGREPLTRKELLWFRRDRRALVQVVLVPVSLAALQAVNLRGVVPKQLDWSTISGLAIVFGTYFLLTLGPMSLASEGGALWIAQTWPRGIETLLRAKARLWAWLASLVVGLALAYDAWRFPRDAPAILAVAVLWWVFAGSLARKTVTLARMASSAGEVERAPAGQRWAALLGTFAFSIGVLTHQWVLAITGVVYSVMTAAAMWQNFRARLPYLADPWSEPMPQAPTLMHAMIAIAVMVEVSSIATGITFGLAGREGIAVVGAFVYAVGAIGAAIVVAVFLKSRGVALRDVWVWRNVDAPPMRRDAGALARAALLAVAGAALGAALAAAALLYLSVLRWWPDAARAIDEGRRHLAANPDARDTYAAMIVLLVPFAEEFLFRGLLYRALDREWGGWRAIAGSAAFFAIYHPATSWLPVGALGAMNALLFKRTGRLAPAVAAHMAYNAIVVLPTFG